MEICINSLASQPMKDISSEECVVSVVSYTELVACPHGTHTTECSHNKSAKDQ